MNQLQFDGSAQHKHYSKMSPFTVIISSPKT